MSKFYALPLGALIVAVSLSSACAQTLPLTFKDDLGTTHTITKPLSRVVVLNRQTAAVMKILKADSKVVAVGDNVNRYAPYLGYGKLPDMGPTNNLNIEAIIAQKPDAVLIFTNRATGVLEEKLNPLGIKVIRIDNYTPATYEQDMKLIAKLFGKEQRAKEYLAFRHVLENFAAQRVKNLPDNQRKRVLSLSSGALNTNGTYYVFPSLSKGGGPGVGEAYGVVLAGGKDAAAPSVTHDPSKGDSTVQVTEEFALSTNPDVLSLNGTWLGGYDTRDTKDFKAYFDKVNALPGIARMKAAKTKDIYFFHTDLLGASMRPIGVLQMGKVLYPERFKDINTERFLKEYFEKWLGVPYKGIWFYTEKSAEKK